MHAKGMSHKQHGTEVIMETRKQSLPAIIFARLARGAVPIDGMYWWDRQQQAASREPVRNASNARVRDDVCASHA